ncbi:acetylcholinesterase [Cadophora sp. MPI-SDFR-AT-0126]|nr:acetylcholinesterase [Leotiomycetes sp. MPI-SDFR-AT-0126]
MNLTTFYVPAALAILLLLQATTCQGSGNDKLTVRTSTGTFTGLIDPNFPNTRQFRAVPFAKPPVVSRRFLAPQKLPRSSEHHWATRFPPSCPQFVTAIESFWNLPLSNGNLIYNGFQNDSSGLVAESSSEDCLYLAVWTPTAPPPEGGFPVLFFMTGGGLVIGGVDIPWQIPASWVERSQSHIVVSINYRLNIIGFPNARGLAGEQQNLGLLDQRIALEWVRDNIAAFGGNPKRITQWGRSAGSISLDILAFAYPEDPIAQAYWLQSGSVLSGRTIIDTTYANFSFVARNVGCAFDDDEDGAAELDCMRQVPFAMLENFIGQYGDRGETPALSFIFIPDDRMVFTDYKARAEAGKFARVPSILSNTANEVSTLVPWPADNLIEGPPQAPITAADVRGVCDAYNRTVYYNRLDVPVYRYQYAGIFPNMNNYTWLGSYHGSDNPMIFGTYDLLNVVAPSTEFQAEVSESLQDHVLAFVKDPYHGPEKIGWTPQVASDPNGGKIMRFGSNGKAAQLVDGLEIDGVCLGLREYDPFP